MSRMSASAISLSRSGWPVAGCARWWLRRFWWRAGCWACSSRRVAEAESFSSVECEFLQQLSEHVALAAHQANLYNALQRSL